MLQDGGRPRLLPCQDRPPSPPLHNGRRAKGGYKGLHARLQEARIRQTAQVHGEDARPLGWRRLLPELGADLHRRGHGPQSSHDVRQASRPLQRGNGQRHLDMRGISEQGRVREVP
ncbi:hypothetical protein M9Y10_042392 [Tritrichomonas musculus]|uniref:Uncharacterized protein n=1 Tax=Tritrichomonas musculus TaxID=1915356 RepID=A0ABR2GJ61_9EUKA